MQVLEDVYVYDTQFSHVRDCTYRLKQALNTWVSSNQCNDCQSPPANNTPVNEGNLQDIVLRTPIPWSIPRVEYQSQYVESQF